MTTTAPASPPPADGELNNRAQLLGLHGLLQHWDEFADWPMLPTLIEYEETERQRRSLERRIRNARIGRFKPMADFDWCWPKEIDRESVEELMRIGFIDEVANVVLVGPNGIGKTMIAQNIAYQALLRGHTVKFVTASEMLNDLAAQDTSSALARRVRRYSSPTILVIDEVGYLSYDSRHGDLLFEVISRRHQHKPIILTTNRIFSEWNQVFPNSSCVTALIDRLLHRAEIVKIDGESYRAKEAHERKVEKAKKRAASKRTKSSRRSKRKE